MRAKKPAFIPPQGIGAGFTLVELLVVISIIALLLGILTPVLVSVRRIAYKTACKQNLHGCAIAFRMYLDENGNYMPTIANMPSLELNNDRPLYEVMAKYLSGKDALKCPADKNGFYFRTEGSSYEYNTQLAGQRIENSRFAKRFGTNEVFLLKDYSFFHGRENAVGSVMYLYADTLVADRKRGK